MEKNLGVENRVFVENLIEFERTLKSELFLLIILLRN
jgi:hypothetical protein